MTVSVIGFDADDTLWHSESHFAVTEQRFRDLLRPWLADDDLSDRLLNRERANLDVFGYGVKGFTLSMIETAIEVSDGNLPASAIQELIGWGKELMKHPVELLDGVAETLDFLAGRYRLVLITKGDLFHQESKVAESGLAPLFERIEIVSEKSPETYRRIVGHCAAPVEQFVMVGNSLRSDVLPVVEIGGRAVYVPYGITWAHEAVDLAEDQVCWAHLDHLHQLPGLLDGL